MEPTRMTPATLYDRWLDLAASKRWAWLLTRYLVIPLAAAVHLVVSHIPEYISETRAEVKELDDLLKAHQASL